MKNRVPISASLVLSNSGAVLVAKALNVLLLLWMQQYLLSRITASEFSLYPVVMSVMLFMMLVKSILTSGLARFITAAHASGDDNEIEAISSTMFAVNLVGGIVLAGAGIMVARHADTILVVEPQFIGELKWMLRIVFLSIAVRMAAASFEVGLIVEQRFKLLSAIEVSMVLLRIGLIAATLLAISPRVLWVVLATETANLGGLAVRVVLSRRVLPALRLKLSRVRLSTARQLVSFGSWNLLGQIAYRIQTSADVLVLNRLATPVDVTAFYLGTAFQRQIGNALGSVTQTAMPGLTAMHMSSQEARIGRAFTRFGRIMIWAYGLVAVPLVVYRTEFYELYVGSEFLLAAPVLLLVMLGEYSNKGFAMINVLAMAKARIKGVMIAALALQITNLGLTLYLVGVLGLGALGSAIATGASAATLRPAVFGCIGLRLADTRFSTWLRETALRGYLPGLAGGLVWLLLREIFPPATWVALFVLVALGAIVYLGVLWFFAAPDQDREVLRSITRRFIPGRPMVGANDG